MKEFLAYIIVFIILFAAIEPVKFGEWIAKIENARQAELTK